MFQSRFGFLIPRIATALLFVFLYSCSSNSHFNSIEKNTFFNKIRNLTRENLNTKDSILKANFIEVDSLRNVYMRAILEGPLEQLKEDIRLIKTKVGIGKKYGVSDNAVKKWMIKYELIKK